MALTPATGLADYASGISTAALQVNSDTGQVSIGTDSPTTARLRVGTAITMSVGVITATDAVFRGNVSIAGTLTYEDVTSIDSVGVLTSRSGVRIPAGGLTVAGVSSFSSALDVNAELDVDGQTDLDNLIVAGVSTFSSSIDLNGELDVDGQTDLDTLQVAGVSTFSAAIDLNAELDVDGQTDLDTLQVAGVSTFSAALDINAATNISGDLTIADKIVHDGDTNTAIRFPGADQVSIETGGSERLLVDASGNVDIGSNDGSSSNTGWFIQPDGSAYVFTNGSTDAVKIFAGSADERITLKGDGELVISDKITHMGDTNTNIRFPAADTFTVETAGSERLRITSAGGALIGGHTTAIDGGNAPNIEIVNTSTSTLSLARNDTSIASGNDIAAIRVWGNDSDGTYQQCAEILAEADGDHGTGDKPTALAFKVTADGASSPTERLRIDSAGDLGLGVAPNNVGSMRTLHIKGPSSEGAAIRLQDNGDTADSHDFQIYKNASAAYLRVNGTDPLRFYLNGADRALIDSSGRLLINTDTSRIVEDHAGNGPQGKIQIEGTNSDAIMSIISAGTADANRCGTISLGRHRNSTVGGTPNLVNAGDSLGAITFAGGDGSDMRTKAAKIICEVDGSPAQDDMPGRLMFFTTPDGDASPDERLRITKDGHVSIVADNKKLLIGAGDDIQVYHDGSNSYVESITGDLNIQATATNADDIVITAKDDVFVRGEGDLIFNTGASLADRMKIHSDGVITMGSAHSAATNAEVTIRATAPQLSLYATPGNVSRITLGDTDDWNIGQIGYDNSDNSMFLSTNNATVLAIDNAGAQVQRQRYYRQVNASNINGSATRTLTITGLRYGTATIHFGGSDGNGQYVHFKINLGGQMWGSGNGYNAEVSSTGYSGGSYSVTKNNTSYVIQVTAGSNTMYYSYLFESTSYTAAAYAVIAES